MNKTTFLLVLILSLILTACGGNAANSAGPASGTQSGSNTGGLSAPVQVAIGIIKLDETEDAVTAKQAGELLPLWETLRDLYTSDTAANQEIEALVAQIQETMTEKQTQAITTMNLTRQDMFSIMQSQGGLTFNGGQNGNAQNGNSSNNNNNRRNFGGGGFPGGNPPDGGGVPGGGGFFQQGQGSRTQSNSSTQNSNRPVTVNPNRIPAPLIQAVIEYLKKKAGP